LIPECRRLGRAGLHGEFGPEQVARHSAYLRFQARLGHDALHTGRGSARIRREDQRHPNSSRIFSQSELQGSRRRRREAALLHNLQNGRLRKIQKIIGSGDCRRAQANRVVRTSRLRMEPPNRQRYRRYPERCSHRDSPPREVRLSNSIIPQSGRRVTRRGAGSSRRCRSRSA
jgi:hypothetical protein